MGGLKWRSDVTITELFAERVRSTPAATALRFRGEEKDKPCD